MVGKTLYDMIKNMFLNPYLIGGINDIFLSLIPKMDHVEKMTEVRPISLCNVSYKVITKILAHRMRPMMETLVSLCQCSFFPNCQSRNSIVIAQEVFHRMRSRKGFKGWMAIKIDLEKAYDRLSWKFVKDILLDIGCSYNFINIIWYCISSSTMKVLWNGEALDEFQPMRGIRQGDPISPYLFVLCIEHLFQPINIVVENSFWNPIKIARGAPKLSHLAFADDLLLFAEASKDQIEVIKCIMNLFCGSSDQKVSHGKTRIYFSNSVGWQRKHHLSQLFGYNFTNDLGKYLGIPILHKKVPKRFFQFILNKVNQRLSSWKAHHLSFAGRLTLMKFVLQAFF